MTGILKGLDQSVGSIVRADPRIRPGEFFGLVLGSGLGAVVDVLEDPVELPYSSIDGFPSPSVSGHSGTLISGMLGGRLVVALRGRVHLYEGHDVNRVVHGVRCLARAGATAMLITNAAGGVRADLGVGNLMVIDDHLNLTGRNPLVGTESVELGERFPDMTRTYEPALASRLFELGKAASLPMARGVYAGVLGPSYETPAEVRMIRTMGGDVVGMSTVLEAIAARQMGARLAGLSIVSNAAAGTSGEAEQTLGHEEVKHAATNAIAGMRGLLKAFLADSESWWAGGAR